jgi:hypothetical protein
MVAPSRAAVPRSEGWLILPYGAGLQCEDFPVERCKLATAISLSSRFAHAYDRICRHTVASTRPVLAKMWGRLIVEPPQFGSFVNASRGYAGAGESCQPWPASGGPSWTMPTVPPQGGSAGSNRIGATREVAGQGPDCRSRRSGLDHLSSICHRAWPLPAVAGRCRAAEGATE